MNISHINTEPMPPVSGDYRASPIGRLLVDMGKLKAEDIERILQVQRKTGLTFGEAARKLRLVSEQDIRHALAIQFDYPYLPADQDVFGKELVAAYQPFSPQVEALRALRSQLTMHWFSHGSKALAVMAANAGEGCSSMAANLAVVFAQLGERTLLIDADLRHPRQKEIFRLGEQRGLSDILIGRAKLDAVTRLEDLNGLSVLGAGAIPPNPQELLNRRSFAEFMRTVEDLYDVVIVDTSPASATADALAVAVQCKGALLVSRLNQTPLADLANAGDQLLLSNVKIVAALVL